MLIVILVGIVTYLLADATLKMIARKKTMQVLKQAKAMDIEITKRYR
jgi:hypothetical protein